MKVEPFGPLVPMLSFKTFDEVIERANNHDLGLSSYICTNSMEKAHKASELMETGTVAVNTPLVAIAEAPFGGIKQAGYGREGGSMAIKDYLNVKYTHLGLKGWVYSKILNSDLYFSLIEIPSPGTLSSKSIKPFFGSGSPLNK